MSESTRSKDIQDTLKRQEALRIEERSLRQNNELHFHSKFETMVALQIELQQSVSAMQTQLHSLAEQTHSYHKNKSVLGEGLAMPPEKGSTSNNPFPIPPNSPDNPTSHNHLSSFPRIEFPFFDGDNPRAWIRRTQRYFQVITTIFEEHKVPLASIHFEGKAELWFQSYMEGKDTITWSQFLLALLDKFDDIDRELMIGDFNKIHQTSTVSHYIEQFEELKSYMLIFNKDFPDDYFIASFISGLRKDIKGSVMTLKPPNLLQAISLAKRQETTINVIIHRASSMHKPSLPPKPPYRAPPPSTSSHPRFSPQPPKPSFQPHRKLLTTVEMRARREQNLCYNCDEVFVPGLRCKQRQVYMIMTQDEEDVYCQEIPEPNTFSDPPTPEDMTISINAISGSSDMNTLRI
ncbi:hypothetical protein BUALT_Bualt19G0042500 [Buddleja alternifolia]|uniref:Ty3 transposon capsid-like protein domain-containing protein n=1 Tax=Buddleja alternifolia TaxID=168488 RepID=A0AAV6W711_9LAMI|nr:hypothetical protein BUALT_Bualt19G0042500 [Buddleja alternifolia]